MLQPAHVVGLGPPLLPPNPSRCTEPARKTRRRSWTRYWRTVGCNAWLRMAWFSQRTRCAGTSWNCSRYSSSCNAKRKAPVPLIYRRDAIIGSLEVVAGQSFVCGYAHLGVWQSRSCVRHTSAAPAIRLILLENATWLISFVSKPWSSEID